MPRRVLTALTCALALLGCKDPPEPDQRVEPPAINTGEADELKREAYREAVERALPSARAALIAADPVSAWQAGLAPAGSPPLRPTQRRALEPIADAARQTVDEIDESYLPAAEVVILRTMRFAFARLNDDLYRRPRLRQDPMVGLHAVATALDELRYQLIHDTCDGPCEALPAALALDVESLQTQLSAASVAGVTRAAIVSDALAHQARTLAAAPLLAEGHDPIRLGLEQLAAACDEHRAWLEQLAAALPEASQTHEWTAKPAPLGLGEASVERLPAIVGAAALTRRLSVEERIDLVPGPAFAEIERHVARWQALREALLAGQDADLLDQDQPRPVDTARCEASLSRLRTELEAIPEVDAPTLDCARYVAMLGDTTLSEGQLVLELLDLGVIEPQRRALRALELPEVALVSGQWSTGVHLHLRRIMLLARLPEPAASALAVDAGREALCWARAALWIHAQIGPPDDVMLTIGQACADLGDVATITARVTGDPRGALAGFGLSLIGDEPARMVGFDRFYWAPLGLMKLLATPKGMHPDEYSLPDDPIVGPDPEVEVKIEKL
ncbi:hypothetical protein DB30_05019 [Enhygromyxa salina]|uniref:Uncharacterized protein n=1 Tax=Enhygromyxa salina TaxID=215803 RepID=A0A0C2D2G3_9BACT|nr:hypothetical protein [Enhygromyxa salina]KIG15965.1 hypothetical protein DB30_05019 [Enhygromyxa salina]